MKVIFINKLASAEILIIISQVRDVSFILKKYMKTTKWGSEIYQNNKMGEKLFRSE